MEKGGKQGQSSFFAVVAWEGGREGGCGLHRVLVKKKKNLLARCSIGTEKKLTSEEKMARTRSLIKSMSDDQHRRKRKTSEVEKTEKNRCVARPTTTTPCPFGTNTPGVGESDSRRHHRSDPLRRVMQSKQRLKQRPEEVREEAHAHTYTQACVFACVCMCVCYPMYGGTHKSGIHKKTTGEAEADLLFFLSLAKDAYTELCTQNRQGAFR
jgi:hypothetical protein